ncbi:hypothetical protein [Mongoliitalea lutea]|uniref:Addiction module component n=1 Tax=Mongoliitalea lutea TaxID=849756 RepID=A0A8J3G725_9BACT|nr:hypothetical protein [Mongoliitalea lutea]GHB52391.1 hypothetical protein GCM10008106_36340 [Mongoliitalea lutea]
MDVPTIKEELFQLIEESDERLLNMLYALAKEYIREDFTLEGKPMTEEELGARVFAAKKSLQSGRFTSQEALEKEVKKW